MDVQTKTFIAEHQLFEWDSVSSVDNGVFVFENVTLKKDIGGSKFLQEKDFKKGQLFVAAIIDYQNSCITFYETKENYHKYDIGFSVGQKAS